MIPPANTDRYKNHRFPGEIISHGVWLYYRFTLSYRDVQELLFERGIAVTYEAIRQWCGKFGQDYANQLRRRRPLQKVAQRLVLCAPRAHYR
jgi:putative transposase